MTLRLNASSTHVLSSHGSGQEKYCQTSNISYTLVSSKIVDHSDLIGAQPVGAAPTTSSFFTSTPVFNGLGKDNGKTRRGTFKFWYNLYWRFKVKFIYGHDWNVLIFGTLCCNNPKGSKLCGIWFLAYEDKTQDCCSVLVLNDNG